MFEIAGAFRPDRHRTKWASSRRTKQHHSSANPVDHSTLQRQPALAKRRRSRGFGKRSPQLMLLRHIAMGFCRTISLRDTLKMCLLHVALFVETPAVLFVRPTRRTPVPVEPEQEALDAPSIPRPPQSVEKKQQFLVEKTTAKTEEHPVHRVGGWMKCAPQPRSQRWMWKE